MVGMVVAAHPDKGEARFFLVMACLMVGTILAGFSFNIVAGRSSFGAPLLVHAHALAMIGWLGLYLAQNALVFSGNVAMHRRLGWAAAVYVPVIVVLGLLVTRHSLQTIGGPPFFDQRQFLISNPLQLLGFAALVGWALVVRRNTGWHRRLLFCSAAILCGPGFGRLLPMPLLIPWAWYVSAFLPLVIFVGAGMLADKRRRGRVHPAWLAGIALCAALQLVADLVAYSPWGLALTEHVIAGTPGAARPGTAFVPPA